MIYTPIKVFFVMIERPAYTALLVFALLLFSYPSSNRPPLDRIAVAALALIAITHFLFFKPHIRLDPLIVVPMMLFVLMGTVTALTHIREIQTWSFLANKYAVPLLLYVIAAIAFQSEKDIRLFYCLQVFIALYLIYISLCWLLGLNGLIWPGYIVTSQEGPFEHYGRSRGPLLNALANGMAITLGTVFGFAWLQMRGSSAVLKYGLMFSGAIAVLCTLTRGAILGFAVAMIILTFRKGFLRIFLGFAALTLLGISFWLLLAPGQVHMEALTTRLTDTQNIEFRLDVNSAAFRVIREHWLTGTGLNQAHKLLPQYIPKYEEDVWIHNSFLEILAEHGLAGAICLIALIAGIARAAHRRGVNNQVNSGIAWARRVWAAVLAVYFINAMMAGISYQYVNGIIFAYAAIVSNYVSFHTESHAAA
jgi:O-antigen ligase